MDVCSPVFPYISYSATNTAYPRKFFFAFICLCFYRNCPVDSTVIQSRFAQPGPDMLLVIHKTVLIYKSLCKLASMYLEDFFNERGTITICEILAVIQHCPTHAVIITYSGAKLRAGSLPCYFGNRYHLGRFKRKVTHLLQFSVSL